MTDPHQARRDAIALAVTAVHAPLERELDQDGTVSYAEMLLVLAEVAREVAQRAAVTEWQMAAELEDEGGDPEEGP